MKKRKFLLAAVATATVMTCALGLTACNNNNSGDGGHGDGQIAAVYQLYASNAQASGEAALTYEQWLESIKGATGATGATGKSAYEIAKENGFTGTEAEWLESLKGNDGEAGTAGKSAYEIAKENGFTGTEAEWLESLKGNDGDRGVGIEGVYETSDGLYVKFTDGTAQPVQNGGVEYQLLVVGENKIEVGSQINTAFNDAPVTIVSFFTLTHGTYKFTLYDNNISLYVGSVNGSNQALVDTEAGAMGNLLNANSFGTNPDGSFYNILTFDKDYQLFVVNWSGSATTVRLTIEKIS